MMRAFTIKYIEAYLHNLKKLNQTNKKNFYNEFLYFQIMNYKI